MGHALCGVFHASVILAFNPRIGLSNGRIIQVSVLLIIYSAKIMANYVRALPPCARLERGLKIIQVMRGIPFRFFARVTLMMASLVLAIFSLTTGVTGEEFVYAAGSIAAVMLASIFRRKRHSHLSGKHRPPVTP